jgi:hypothetical protein
MADNKDHANRKKNKVPTGFKWGIGVLLWATIALIIGIKAFKGVIRGSFDEDMTLMPIIATLCVILIGTINLGTL